MYDNIVIFCLLACFLHINYVPCGTFIFKCMKCTCNAAVHCLVCTEYYMYFLSRCTVSNSLLTCMHLLPVLVIRYSVDWLHVTIVISGY